MAVSYAYVIVDDQQLTSFQFPLAPAAAPDAEQIGLELYHI